ncbi:helix-turn-helix transcriptional regulator [Lachnospiraceae bacterium OttesenSCG-928-E19]|nr:helix-turn-helix transcriptional regulator [Lachnospiraceae bacterium OttesenSCG-928-E19]
MARTKTIYDPKYKSFINEMVRIRKEKGLTQRDLAKMLGEAHVLIGTIELRSRRVDVLETYKILKALGLSKSEISKLLEKYFY